MGKFDQIIYERIIPSESDRHANRVRVHRAGEEITIHFRNLKIVLHNKAEVDEWKEGFTEALEKLGDHFKYDI